MWADLKRSVGVKGKFSLSKNQMKKSDKVWQYTKYNIYNFTTYKHKNQEGSFYQLKYQNISWQITTFSCLISYFVFSTRVAECAPGGKVFIISMKHLIRRLFYQIEIKINM